MKSAQITSNPIRIRSRGLRLWHWLDALVVTGLIVTFFLRDGLVSRSRFLVKRLNEGGIAISDQASRPVIREMVDQLWAWHIYLGYALTVLLAFRLALLITDRENPVLDCWQAICEMRGRFDFRSLHSAVVKSGYVAFYLLQIFMVITGLLLAFSDPIGIPREFQHLVNEAHETVMWFFLAFAIAHIAGVFTAENRGDPGIVSAMINGHRQ